MYVDPLTRCRVVKEKEALAKEIQELQELISAKQTELDKAMKSVATIEKELAGNSCI